MYPQRKLTQPSLRSSFGHFGTFEMDLGASFTSVARSSVPGLDPIFLNRDNRISSVFPLATLHTRTGCSQHRGVAMTAQHEAS